MNFKLKRKNLFLIDDISPYKNFINARKTLTNTYLKSKTSEKNIKQKTVINRNNNKFNNIKIKTQKIYSIKAYTQKLLNEQKFIISHFIKNNESKKENYLYDSNSFLKTLDRINYYRYNNDKVNFMTKYSHKNIFKTIPSETIKKGSKSVKKEKIKYENINLPMIQHIVRKKAKFKDFLYKDI